jgi:hypothetical protein
MLVSVVKVDELQGLGALELISDKVFDIPFPELSLTALLLLYLELH